MCIGCGRLRTFRYAKSSENAGDWAIVAMLAIGIKRSIRIMFGRMILFQSELKKADD
jgi:hypothetical protein